VAVEWSTALLAGAVAATLTEAMVDMAALFTGPIGTATAPSFAVVDGAAEVTGLAPPVAVALPIRALTDGARIGAERGARAVRVAAAPIVRQATAIAIPFAGWALTDPARAGTDLPAINGAVAVRRATRSAILRAATARLAPGARAVTARGHEGIRCGRAAVAGAAAAGRCAGPVATHLRPIRADTGTIPALLPARAAVAAAAAVVVVDQHRVVPPRDRRQRQTDRLAAPPCRVRGRAAVDRGRLLEGAAGAVRVVPVLRAAAKSLARRRG
jgi:hypothetical protein